MGPSAEQVVNRMIEEIQNRQNLEAVYEIFSDRFVNHTPIRGLPPDREGMRRLFAMTHTGFPDGRVTIEDQARAGARVWTRKSFTGTHTGVYAGLEPTGRVVTYRVMDILAVRDGLIAEHWSVVDRLDLYEQLGLVRSG